jgi:acetylornithine/succinyldiaminopimelate/putrescine aminotransferase
VDNVAFLSSYVRDGLDTIMKDSNGFFKGIRQRGVIFGLEFDHPEGAKFVMRTLYENGVWAIFSTLDPQVLQFKIGLLCDKELIDDLLERVAVGVAQAGEIVRKLA